MNQIFLIIRTAFILLFLGYFQNTQAGSNKLSCALKSEQQFLGALPEFSHKGDLLLGYQCQLVPNYSRFLGNWFPSLPNLYLSQVNRLSVSNNASYNATSDDVSKTWKVALSIKRFGQSQLSIFTGKKDWQQVLQAKEDIAFIPSSANSVSDAITINKGQQARLNSTEEYFGFSFILPSKGEKELTEIRLQRTIINQPIQANIISFEKSSLFTTKTETNEIIIISQSYHRGLNINWQFGLGQGKVILEPEKQINFDSESDQTMSLRGQLELYYQYRFNRRWFGHLGWQGSMYYWQQNIDDKSYKLKSVNNLKQQLFLGIGLSF
jgi:hypothetical protein